MAAQRRGHAHTLTNLTGKTNTTIALSCLQVLLDFPTTCLYGLVVIALAQQARLAGQVGTSPATT